MTVTTKTVPGLLIIVLIVCLVAGCDDDSPQAFDATIDELWPNEDGRWWEYDLHVAESETDLGDLKDPDIPLPSVQQMSQLVADLAHDGQPTSEDYLLRTSFSGMLTTSSGATGQALVEELEDVESNKASICSANPIQDLIWSMRPDLRERLPEPAKVGSGDNNPYGLTGYCWTKTETYIGGYGDLNADLSWLYLKAPLRTGSTFTMQLVPDIADNIWLHGLIERQLAWTQGETTYPRVVEIFLLIDLGVQVMTDDQGNATEMERSWACSRTVYAPGVGPVYTREWRSTAGDSVLQDPAGYLEIEAALVDTGVSEI